MVKEKLLGGLARYNYFTAQDSTREEVPPLLSSSLLLLPIAKKIHNEKKLVSTNYANYEFVEYKDLKISNVSRYLVMLHPKAQVDLASDVLNSGNVSFVKGWE